MEDAGCTKSTQSDQGELWSSSKALSSDFLQHNPKEAHTGRCLLFPHHFNTSSLRVLTESFTWSLILESRL